MHPLGKILIGVGLVIVLAGIALMFADKIPLLGKLPGDIVVRKKNFTFYFPITTLIVLNLALWLIIWLIGKFK
ncbi:MAG: DUF2905 domain-containing protein [Calditrichaceae bacterium]|nr:DUF2905 domain-containing protein [Calditrichaceae bacterium]